MDRDTDLPDASRLSCALSGITDKAKNECQVMARMKARESRNTELRRQRPTIAFVAAEPRDPA
jgi:hypothetical protein